MTLDAGRRGILFAAAGSSTLESQAVFDRIGQAALLRFPGVEVRWAFTSSGVRRKLAQQGRRVAAPSDALEAMQAEGFTTVAVTSLHLSDGMEYSELADTVKAFRTGTGPLTNVALGKTLMADEEGWRQALKALLASVPARGPGEAVLLVAHGSLDARAVKTIAHAISVCRQVDPALFLGMILGSPSQDQIVDELRAAGLRKVWVLPCLIAAGVSAHEDIAGAGDHSWLSVLERAGLTCIPILKGLGECDGIVDVWLTQSMRVLESLSAYKE